MNHVLLSDPKGKLLTCCITGRGKTRYADIQLLCVGKPKSRMYEQFGWIYTPALAPSPELVTHTKIQQKKMRLEWWNFYKDSLLTEWESSKEFYSSLSEVVSFLQQGKTVAVACYCPSVRRSRCHLSILADIVRDLGYETQELPDV